MTKKELAIAEARHAKGERWYGGPELLNAFLADSWFGIGTREELDALKTDGVLPVECDYRPVTPQDLA